MGRCGTCGKKIGLFFQKWRKLGGAKHCLQCVPTVMAQRRQATRDAIFAGTAPRVIFLAPVISRDLDYPGNSRRYTGALILADKGVIFAQHGEYKKAQSGAAAFGLLGAIYDSVVEKGRLKAASAALTDMDVGNATALMDQAEQLFFFPVADIRKLKGNNSYLDLKMLKDSAVFRWMNAGLYIKPNRLLLDTYVHAVNSGRDILVECSAFLRR